MGLLRILFALSVVINHSLPLFGYKIVGADIAVRSFFIISGFYMGLILNEKYIKKNGSYFLFLTNRWLRIFPIYFIVLFVMLVTDLVWMYTGKQETFIVYFQSLHPKSVFDFLQTFWEFVILNVTLIFSRHLAVSDDVSKGFLIVNQGWTLQQELLFYLIAPFIALRKGILLVAIFLFFYFLRRFWIDPYLVFGNHSVIYRFVETVIFFIIGLLVYKLYRRVKKYNFDKRTLLAISVVFILLTLVFLHLPFPSFLSQHAIDWLYYFLLALFLPFIFIASSRLKIDNFIGDLSYPLYLIHFVILQTLLIEFSMPKNELWVVIGTALSLIASYFLVKIEMPIERFRQRRVKKINR